MNATSNQTFSSDNIKIIDYAIFFPQLVYAIIGGLDVIGNVLIIISIAHDAQLREQRILVMALAISDLLNAIGYHGAGIVRIVYLFNEMYSLFATPFECMQRFWNPIWIVAEISCSVFSLLIAIDRFCAVTFPIAYHVAGRKREITAVTSIATYFAIVIAMAFAFLVAYNLGPERNIPYSCTTTAAMGPIYGNAQLGFCIVIGTLALFLYMVTVTVYRMQNVRLKKNNDSAAHHQLQRESKMVNVMAFIVALDFLFFIVPMSGFLVLGAINRQSLAAICAPFFGTLAVTHTVVNSIIYGVKDTEMRRAYLKTLRRLLLPFCCGSRSAPISTVAVVSSATSKLDPGRIQRLSQRPTQRKDPQ